MYSASRCSWSARPSQWAPDKGATGEEVERLGTLVQVTNTNRSWSEMGNYNYYNYYCRVTPICQDSCCTGEGGFLGPKCSNPPTPIPSWEQCSKLERLIQQELKYLGLIWLQHLSISVHALKVFWSSRNGSFVFNQIFVYGTLMGVDYKSEKKI